MADFLSGLGGLVKGLSGLMPQDDPAVKILQTRTELENLKKKETEIYAAMGRQMVEQGGGEQFPELLEELRVIQRNLAATEEKVRLAMEEKESQEQAEQAARDSRICPACGHENPEQAKFCQSCGTKVEAKNHCPSCGLEQPLGTKFCGSCGTRISS